MVTRRSFICWAGALGAAMAAGCAGPVPRRSSAGGRVVVVGGGFGGAACARYLKRFAPRLEVVVIEPASRFVSCPASNGVIGGLLPMERITFAYDGLQRLGIQVVHDWVETIDGERRRLTLHGGETVAYDRLVVSPGIDLRYAAVDGYGPAVAESIPHGWKAGEQTKLLRRQLAAMADGNVVFIGAPAGPYRCPPGPYERASLIAHYLQREKPKSKVIILDAKDRFPKQELFEEGWRQLYPGYVEWVGASEGGRVVAVDGKRRRLVADGGEFARTGDVINLIPPQRAGAIALRAALADESGWCPVDPRTFESRRQPGIHVIGDAAVAGELPKSASAANSEAKVCAAAIVSALAGVPLPEPSFINACYSLLAPDYGISVAGVYRVDGETIRATAGGVTPAGQPARHHRDEARYARAWFRNIVDDTFAPAQPERGRVTPWPE